jgi:hypothetical protein
VRLLVVLVVTVALLIAATPIALSQAPRLHSPLLAVVAFGIAVIALVAGVALLVRATSLGRRAVGTEPAGPRRGAVAARVVPSPRRGWDRAGDPPADESVTEPRAAHEHIELVPVAGRITVSASASATGPRHALVAPLRHPRQDPSTAGQSPTGPSHTQAQQSTPLDDADPDDADPDAAVTAAAAERSAAFAARYTTTRSRR